MKRVIFSACKRSHFKYALIGYIRYAKLLEGNGQSNLNAEIKNIVELIGILKDELCNRAKGNLFSMVHGMCFAHGSQAVVNGVGACETC